MTCSAQLLLNVDTVFKLYLSGARFDFLILAAAEHCVYITAGHNNYKYIMGPGTQCYGTSQISCFHLFSGQTWLIVVTFTVLIHFTNLSCISVIVYVIIPLFYCS